MLCGDGGFSNIQLMLKEIYRVLSPTGVYICISVGTPKQRKKYLKNTKMFNWTIAVHQIQKPGIGPNVKEIKTKDKNDKKNFHFIYVCRK